MGGDAWDDLPVDAVPALTSASLRLVFPTGKGNVELGLSLAGTALEREWQVGVASACDPVAGQRVTVLAAAARPQLTLADLPVVGPRLPATAVEVTRVALVARTGDRPPGKELTDKLLTLLDPGESTSLDLDASALAGKASLGAEIVVAGEKRQAWITFGGPNESQRPAPATTPAQAASATPSDNETPVLPAQTLATAPEPAPPAPPTAVWLDVSKALGPLQLHRVGFAYRTDPTKRLCLLVDASLGAVGLTFDAIGLGLAVAMDGSFAISGLLDGLGLSYAVGPTTIAGALIRDTHPAPPLTLSISGILVVTTPELAFLAAGMYGELVDGRTTVFVVGEVSGLHVPLDPVEITGLIGGFGYNSDLSIPDRPEDVARYPLVAGIGDRQAMPVDKGAAAVLEKLDALIKPAGDHVWVAIGVTFNVFKLVEATAVVAVQVSREDVLVAVLGTARIRFPQNSRPYVCLTLGLRAVYRLSTGELSLSGALDPTQSYLVNQDCRVQGGFAMYTWLPPSEHAGDFVITFGGYHPGYRPPAHYPQAVERIGVVWQPSDCVEIRGEAYAAVTPSMLQVGGILRVEYSSSVVSAWLRAEMNATVQWEPFRFELYIGIQVGVEIRFLGTHHLELSVELTLWGPPTGGVACVELPVVPNLHIRFGADRPADVAALNWQQFHERVLSGRKLQTVIASGLLHEQAPADSEGEPAEVAVPRLALSVRTPVPCTALDRDAGTGSTSSAGREITRVAGGGKVPVRPMHTHVTAHCTLALTRDGKRVDLGTWTITPDTGGVPASVWGPLLENPQATPPVHPADAELIDGALIGARATPPPAPTCADPPVGPIPKARLELDGGARGLLPVPERPRGDLPLDGARQRVADTIDTAGAGAARRDLFAQWTALGVAPGDPVAPPLDALTGYRTRLWSTLTTDPMLVPDSGRSR